MALFYNYSCEDYNYDMHPELTPILEGVKNYLVNPDIAKLERAYKFAVEIHGDQKRFSGEPYITHPLRAAQILLRMRPDIDTICACILHDTVEDDRTQQGQKLLDRIAREFGKDTASIVDGVTKLGRVRYTGQEREVESLRKMFVAMAKDVRVILVRLADRLHNLQTLYHVAEHKQLRIAQETLEVYVAVAARLGLYEIKHELEDLCFYYIYPAEHKKISDEMASEKTDFQNQIRLSVNKINALLRRQEISAEVSGRMKNLYSIYRKMQKKGFQSIRQVHDIFGVRIVVNDLPACYTVLGLVHSEWTPVPGRFKDYIAKPKINGYQSLHTELVGLVDKPVEIQIRTYEMHRTAEFGVAAHWHYKQNKSSVPLSPGDHSWLKGILSRHSTTSRSEDFLKELQLDFFEDEIFVFTPQGQVRALPEGATPVDFAYQIHTEVGHSTRGAKVDGHIVPLDYKLKNGETVEIITQKKAEPSRYWLQFVKTNSAREKIKSFLGSQNHEKHLKLGHDMLNELLAQEGLPPLDTNFTALRELDGKRLSLTERQEMLERVGNGSISANSIVRKIYPEPGGASQHKNKVQSDKGEKTEKVENKIRRIIVGGQLGLDVKMAKCCTPEFPAPIFGYNVREGQIAIHRKSCPNRSKYNPVQILPAHWEGHPEHDKLFRIEIALNEKADILPLLVEKLHDYRIDIESMRAMHEREQKILSIDVSTPVREDLHPIRDLLKNHKEVIHVNLIELGEK